MKRAIAYRCLVPALALALAWLRPAPAAAGPGGETADVTVPPAVTFTVTSLGQTTSGGVARVSFANANMNGNHRLEISVKADAVSFTVPSGGTAIPAADVSWTISGSSGGTGSAGTLDAASYTRIFLSDKPCPASGYVDISWSLAAQPTTVRAGVHTLTLRWMFDSVNK